LSFNFMMNRTFTFNTHTSSILHQIPKYAIVQTIAFIVNVGVSLIIVTILPKTLLNANIASLSGIVCALPVNFLGSLLWTFRK
jgi:putative flippase GtrA